MATLTSKQRKALPESAFALPGRRYPIQDIDHARNALARVAQNGTPAEIAAVKRAVKRRYPNLGQPPHETAQATQKQRKSENKGS